MRTRWKAFDLTDIDRTFTGQSTDFYEELE